MRTTFDVCPTKFYYSYIENLKPKGVSIHLHFGKCLAAGLEILRKEYYSHGDLVEAKTRAVERILKDWGEVEAPEKSPKTLEACILALDSYIEQYPPQEDHIQPAILNGQPAVEFTFALPIPGIEHPEGGPILYTGRFDMIAEQAGALFIFDDKTTGQLGKSWANSFTLASQFLGYKWACDQYGIKTEGDIIRGIGIYKTYFAHQMLINYRPNWQVDRWLSQLQRDVRRMIACWEVDTWDMSMGAGCNAYGGCEFLTLCTVRKPEDYIEGYYEARDWDPLG